MPRTTKRVSKQAKAKPDRETCTAYHEAGHAVIAFWRRVPIKHVTIVPNPKEGSLGTVTHRKLPRGIADDLTAGVWEEETRRRLEGHIDVCLAGGLAVKILGGRNPYRGADQDINDATNWVFGICGSGEQATAYLKWRNLCVRDGLKGRWRDVEAVARALLERKRLSRAEVRAILVPPLPPFEIKEAE